MSVPACGLIPIVLVRLPNRTCPARGFYLTHVSILCMSLCIVSQFSVSRDLLISLNTFLRNGFCTITSVHAMSSSTTFVTVVIPWRNLVGRCLYLDLSPHWSRNHFLFSFFFLVRWRHRSLSNFNNTCFSSNFLQYNHLLPVFYFVFNLAFSLILNFQIPVLIFMVNFRFD